MVTNAGGINPQAAANALRQIAQDQGIELKVSVVEGDNLMPQLEKLRAADVREMRHDTPLPERVLAMNAYLGAFPIAKALDDGADVVITGRVVDSANLLSRSSENALNQRLQQLEQQTTHQVVVATLKSLQGTTIEDYRCPPRFHHLCRSIQY